MSHRLIIFDTDGTLMDGRLAVIDAVADGLAATYDHFQIPAPEPDRERIALAMGLVDRVAQTSGPRAAREAAVELARPRGGQEDQLETAVVLGVDASSLDSQIFGKVVGQKISGAADRLQRGRTCRDGLERTFDTME